MTFSLQEEIRLAERRVVLASLFFGTGNSTDDLVRITNHQQLHNKLYNKTCIQVFREFRDFYSVHNDQSIILTQKLYVKLSFYTTVN